MILLFGVSDCDKCNGVKAALHHLNVPFNYLDANAPENQEIADKYEVNDLPHIVITNNDSNPVEQHIGQQCLDFVSKMQVVRNA